ncbi:MAG: isoprenyl transferase, partial [Acidimicrobiia bacterium]|nr:isoprenyl transferase [Acidimicrobiia bacterium]
MSFPPPRHVGVIMDGNGRWAAKRGLPRVAGHAAGEKAVLDVLEGALEAGIEWFTLFLFSTENWRRSAEEVSFLMKFCDDLLSRRGQELVERGARLHVAGDLADPRIPDSVRRRISETLSLT